MITALCLNPSLDRTVYVERLEIGGTNRVLREHTVPGGKGVNVARMMASFGLPTRAALFLGREDERLMEETLSLWGCGMRSVMLDGALRVNIKVMDQSRGEITELNASGSPVNAEAVVKSMQFIKDNAKFVQSLSQRCSGQAQRIYLLP